MFSNEKERLSTRITLNVGRLECGPQRISDERLTPWPCQPAVTAVTAVTAAAVTAVAVTAAAVTAGGRDGSGRDGSGRDRQPGWRSRMLPIASASLAAATPTPTRVCVVGAGVAGLRCAQILASTGCSVTVLESSDGVGGRVRTDLHEGFQLDRGFQVFLTAYPESQQCLDYESLDLHEFVPGACVQLGDGGANRFLVADVSRRPSTLLDTLRFPVGSRADKLKLVLAVLRLKFFRDLDALFSAAAFGKSQSTMAYLRDELQLDSPLIDSFFRPFFKGIFLAPLEELYLV